MTRLAERFVEALDSHQGSRVVALVASELRSDYRCSLVSEQMSETSDAGPVVGGRGLEPPTSSV